MNSQFLFWKAVISMSLFLLSMIVLWKNNTLKTCCPLKKLKKKIAAVSDLCYICRRRKVPTKLDMFGVWDKMEVIKTQHENAC